MGEPVAIDTATWRLDYEDGSGPRLLVEVDRDAVIWVKQHDDRILLKDLAAATWLHDALRQAIRTVEQKHKPKRGSASA